MTRRPSFTALKAFESLVRCGSIHKAAQDIHVSPGAISQQVRLLESDLDIKLFDRNGRSMKPLREARELAEEISQSFAKIDHAIDRLTKSANTIQLKIASLPSIATRIVLPRLAEFRVQLPEVQLSFNYIHRIEDINSWDADILICAVDVEYTGEGCAQELMSGAVQPFASKAYVERNGPFDKQKDMEKAQLLHDFSTKAWWSWFESNGLDTSNGIEGDIFEDFELLIHSLLADQGMGLCPPALVSNEIDTGKLQPVFDNYVLESRKYVVVVSEQAKKEASIFANWLVHSTNNVTPYVRP